MVLSMGRNFAKRVILRYFELYILIKYKNKIKYNIIAHIKKLEYVLNPVLE